METQTVLYTTKQAAAMLGKSHKTVWMLANKHKIGSVMGHTLLLTAADIETLRAIPGPGRPKQPAPAEAAR